MMRIDWVESSLPKILIPFEHLCQIATIFIVKDNLSRMIMTCRRLI